VLLHQDNKLAFVLRSHTGYMDGHYGLPSGKVEKNESYLAAAVREAREEIGVDIKTTDLAHTLTVHRDSTDGSSWVDIYFTAASWAGEPYNAEPHKHSEFAWLDIDNLPENVIPDVRHSLQQIQAKQSYTEYGWAS
jgi:8-oxo-dGTP pyrophosphatase MutT (NUDIX family)